MGEAAYGGDGKPLSCVSGMAVFVIGAAVGAWRIGKDVAPVGILDGGRLKNCVLLGKTGTPPKRFCAAAFGW